MALAHAIDQLDEDDAAARDAAADFSAQIHRLTAGGRSLYPGADPAAHLAEAGYAEYIIARSKIRLRDASFGQHLGNAQLLFEHAAPLTYPYTRVKTEIDEFIAAHRRADRS